MSIKWRNGRPVVDVYEPDDEEEATRPAAGSRHGAAAGGRK
jgi:hypothetical protein